MSFFCCSCNTIFALIGEFKDDIYSSQTCINLCRIPLMASQRSEWHQYLFILYLPSWRLCSLDFSHTLLPIIALTLPPVHSHDYQLFYSFSYEFGNHLYLSGSACAYESKFFQYFLFILQMILFKYLNFLSNIDFFPVWSDVIVLFFPASFQNYNFIIIESLLYLEWWNDNWETIRPFQWSLKVEVKPIASGDTTDSYLILHHQFSDSL